MITDSKTVILRVNQAFIHTTGYTSEEAVGQTPNHLGLILNTPDFNSAMWEDVHRTGIWHGEVCGKRKNGETYPTWLTISARQRSRRSQYTLCRGIHRYNRTQ